MAQKLPLIINSLSEEDLYKLKADLEAGHIHALIHKRLEQLQPNKEGICPVCSAQVSSEDYTLIFGPASFKQKASFDGLDCLDYFLERLKTKNKN